MRTMAFALLLLFTTLPATADPETQGASADAETAQDAEPEAVAAQEEAAQEEAAQEEAGEEDEAQEEPTLTLGSTSEASDLIRKAMDLVAAGDIPAAVAAMRPYMIIPAADIDSLQEQLEASAPATRERFGDELGMELLREEQLGSSLMKIAYLQKHEMHIVHWRFFLYRPADGWVISTIKRDTNLEGLFSGS
ncbi:MAG: hypothetical protein AAGN66_02485 [Acidobacteriota bacterium]